MTLSYYLVPYLDACGVVALDQCITNVFRTEQSLASHLQLVDVHKILVISLPTTIAPSAPHFQTPRTECPADVGGNCDIECHALSRNGSIACPQPRRAWL